MKHNKLEKLLSSMEDSTQSPWVTIQKKEIAALVRVALAAELIKGDADFSKDVDKSFVCTGMEKALKDLQVILDKDN